MSQVNEVNAVQEDARERVAECGPAVVDYLPGSERELNYIVGQVMKKRPGARPMRARCTDW